MVVPSSMLNQVQSNPAFFAASINTSASNADPAPGLIEISIPSFTICPEYRTSQLGRHFSMVSRNTVALWRFRGRARVLFVMNCF